MIVMPGPGRLLRALMDYYPALGPALNRAAGVRKTLDEVLARRAAQLGDDEQSASADQVA
jgi:hypothetical protein